MGQPYQIPIAATVEGFTPAKVICRNLDTRQTVIITDGSPSVDCEAAGLTIADGERVDIIVKGTK